MGAYVKNLETQKIELHFDKKDFLALTAEQKKELKSAYLWSNYSKAWVSRSKNSHYWAIQTAKKLGFTEEVITGERLSYEEQLQVKAEKAERRIERYETYSDNAQKRGEQLQKELDNYRGDIAFFTQPIIAGHAGSERFAKQRERIFDRYRKGFEEYRKSEYFKEKAITAQNTAEQKQLKNKVYLDNRIKETNADIRDLERHIIWAEQGIHDGKPYEKDLENYLGKMVWQIDKLSFLQNCLDELGGIEYNKDNIKPGYLVKIRGTWDKVLKANKTTVETIVIEGGAKGFILKHAYSEIQELKIPDNWTEPKETLDNPFQIGDIVYRTAIGGNRIISAYEVVKITGKTATIQQIKVEENKPVAGEFISDKQERRAVKKDRSGNFVVNADDWYLYKYTA